MKTCLEPNNALVQREFELGVGPTSRGTNSGGSFFRDSAPTNEAPASQEPSPSEDLNPRRGAGHVARGCPDN